VSTSVKTEKQFVVKNNLDYLAGTGPTFRPIWVTEATVGVSD